MCPLVSPPLQPHQQCLYHACKCVHPCDVYIIGHVDDHVLRVHVYIVPTMLTELLYPLQNGNTPLHLAAMSGHTACVERLLSNLGIDVNIEDEVSCCI